MILPPMILPILCLPRVRGGTGKIMGKEGCVVEFYFDSFDSGFIPLCFL